MSNLNPYEEGLAIDLTTAQARIVGFESALRKRAIRIEELEVERNAAMQEAVSLAVWLHHRFYQKQAPQWTPLEDVAGVISQIDNMTAGLADRIAKLEYRLAKAVDALGEAIYLLDPDEEDIAKETGLHRIVTTYAELTGGKDE